MISKNNKVINNPSFQVTDIDFWLWVVMTLDKL